MIQHSGKGIFKEYLNLKCRIKSEINFRINAKFHFRIKSWIISGLDVSHHFRSKFLIKSKINSGLSLGLSGR